MGKYKSFSLRFLILLIISLVIAFSSSAEADEESDLIPERGKHFYFDGAGLMSENTKQKIDNVNKRLADMSGSEIIIMTIDGGWSKGIADKAAEKWRLEENSRGSGAVVVINAEDKKIASAAWSGEGSYVNLANVKRMEKEYLIPPMVSGDYDKGIADFIEAMGKQHDDWAEFTIAAEKKNGMGQVLLVSGVFIIALMIMIRKLKI